MQLEAHFAYREITEDAAKYTIAVVTIDKDVIVELPKFEEPKFENLTRWLKNVYGLKQMTHSDDSCMTRQQKRTQAPSSGDSSPSCQRTHTVPKLQGFFL